MRLEMDDTPFVPESVLTTGQSVIDRIPKLTEEQKRLAKLAIWEFFLENKDRLIGVKRILFYEIRLRLGRAKWLFVLLAGPNPFDP